MVVVFKVFEVEISFIIQWLFLLGIILELPHDGCFYLCHDLGEQALSVRVGIVRLCDNAALSTIPVIPVSVLHIMLKCALK